MFAMVAISDYTIVGVGNTMREALTSFKTCTMSGNKINPIVFLIKLMTTIVTRIQNDVKMVIAFTILK
jgi:hypothetical protein